MQELKLETEARYYQWIDQNHPEYWQEIDYYNKLYKKNMESVKQTIKEFLNTAPAIKERIRQCKIQLYQLLEDERRIKSDTSVSAAWEQAFLETYQKQREELNKELNRLSWLSRPQKDKNIAGITPRDISDAKAVNIDYILEFNRAGFAKCPFHEERTGSFHWDKRYNRGYCFGCGWKGDGIDLICKLEGLSFQEGVKRLLSKI